MKSRTLSVTDYGIYVICMESLKRFLINKGIKNKNILRVFQDNYDLYIESLREGIWIPIVPINSIKYEIMMSCDETVESNWEKIFSYEGFNLNVEDGNVWIGSFGSLINFKISQFKNPSIDRLSYQTLDGETLHKGFRINLNKGKYHVRISGYKKRITSDFSIYGYGFDFKPTDEFTTYKDPREDEKYTFNITS